MDKENAIVNAIAQMSLLQYFPTEKHSQKALMIMVDQMCESAESVQWLGNQMIAKYSEWPGPAILRGVYCSRYKPFDGVTVDLPEGDPTFRDAEQRAVTQSNAHKQVGDEAIHLVKELVPDPLADPEWDKLVKRYPGIETDSLRHSQDKQWAKLCARYPVTRVFPHKSKDFAVGNTVVRAEILLDITTRLERLQKQHLGS